MEIIHRRPSSITSTSLPRQPHFHNNLTSTTKRSLNRHPRCSSATTTAAVNPPPPVGSIHSRSRGHLHNFRPTISRSTSTLRSFLPPGHSSTFPHAISPPRRVCAPCYLPLEGPGSADGLIRPVAVTTCQGCLCMPGRGTSPGIGLTVDVPG